MPLYKSLIFCILLLVSSSSILALKLQRYIFTLNVKHFYVKYLELKKQSLYRPGQACGLQEVEAPRYWESQHTKVVRFSALATFTPQEIFVVLIVRTRINPRAIVWPEGLCQWKIPVTASGIGTCYLSACSAVPQPTGFVISLCLNIFSNLIWKYFIFDSTYAHLQQNLLFYSFIGDLPDEAMLRLKHVWGTF